MVVIMSLIFLFLIYNSFIPIPYYTKYKDKKVYRYRFTISKIDSLRDSVYVKKIGGALNYFGLKNVECLDTLDKKLVLIIKNSLDSLNTTLRWKLIRDGLYINKNREIGFYEVRALGAEAMLSVDNYITKFGWGEGKSLKSVIDMASFIGLGSSFYKDKNHIYEYYGMAYGGYLSIFGKADYKTFEVIGDAYARDKNHIYAERTGVLEQVDYETFTSVFGIGAYAKDKNGYYWWGDKIDTSNYKVPEIKAAIVHFPKFRPVKSIILDRAQRGY